MSFSLRQDNKWSGMECDFILCLIIDRYLPLAIISPLFWRLLAKLPLWLFDVRSDVMQINRGSCVFLYCLCVSACVCWWGLAPAACSNKPSWGIGVFLNVFEQDCTAMHFYTSCSYWHKIWLFAKWLIFFFKKSDPGEKWYVSRMEPNLRLYTGPECLANFG